MRIAEIKKLDDTLNTTASYEEKKAAFEEADNLEKQNIKTFLLQYLLVLSIIFLLFIPPSKAQTEILLDQQSRLIVADLGSQYVVQSAELSKDGTTLNVNNSCYAIADSSNEIVTVLTINNENIEYKQK